MKTIPWEDRNKTKLDIIHLPFNRVELAKTTLMHSNHVNGNPPPLKVYTKWLENSNLADTPILREQFFRQHAHRIDEWVTQWWDELTAKQQRNFLAAESLRLIRQANAIDDVVNWMDRN